MDERISRTLISFAKRAERLDKETLIESFVDVGPLFTVLSTVDNQVLYGRRGTGKTHALKYLAESMNVRGDVAIYIDLRSVGSTGGIYSDPELPLSERASRLLVDTLAAIHEGLLEVALDDASNIDLSRVGPLLDDFAQSISEVIVRGPIEQELTEGSELGSSQTAEVKIGGTLKSIDIGLGIQSSDVAKVTTSTRSKFQGVVQRHIHFGRVGNVLDRLCKAIDERRLWVILDEWSVIPIDLQPYLADLLRRSIFPIAQISVKIGAIEKRSDFQVPLPGGDYIGIELGGDASADINLDDYMVFDNDEERATSFFKTLIYRHFSAEIQFDAPNPFNNADDLVKTVFTQENVFREFVRASEGIPRDAFNILSQAAQSSFAASISMDIIRKTSKTWYQRDKESAVAASPISIQLLHWIIDRVIAHRRARAFLLDRRVSHELIDKLYDARVIHLLKRNISAHDQPGVRYDVYKIDYGCYVDLLSTARSPNGLLELDDGSYIDVPPDDYRAIRRAILHLREFESEVSNIIPPAP